MLIRIWLKSDKRSNSSQGTPILYFLMQLEKELQVLIS